MGLQFIAQRPVCALFIEGAKAFKHKKCILKRMRTFARRERLAVCGRLPGEEGMECND